MIVRHQGRAIRVGVVVHGTTLWISEIISIVFVLALLSVLGWFSFTILWNELTISRLEAEISTGQTQKLALQHRLELIRERRRISAALLGFTGHRIDTSLQDRLVDLVHANSRQFGYDPLLVLAVINVESIFDPRARGRFRSGEISGALGLMQLKFETAREMAASLGIPLTSEEDLFEPEVNLVLGVAYLTKVIAQFKSLKLGILAYNQGPGAVRGTLSRREPLSAAYYEKVLRSYYRLREHAEAFRKQSESAPTG